MLVASVKKLSRACIAVDSNLYVILFYAEKSFDTNVLLNNFTEACMTIVRFMILYDKSMLFV